MDLKYTEVSKQIGLAASHIEFDSQNDRIFIDCYLVWEMPQVKIIIFSYFTQICVGNCCSLPGVWYKM